MMHVHHLVVPSRRAVWFKGPVIRSGHRARQPPTPGCRDHKRENIMNTQSGYQRRFAAVLVLALLSFAACGSDDPAGPDDKGRTPVVYYVYDEATGNEDGSSWEDAFTHPADAMAIAQKGDELWVHSGTFNDQDLEPSTPFLVLKPGVGVYGGFRDTITTKDQRDFRMNPSNFDGSGAHHVVVGANGAVLDGVIIKDGRAEGTGEDSHGAGLYAVDVTMTVANCTFRNNEAAMGAGAYVRGGVVTFASCLFRENFAYDMGAGTVVGGGLYLEETVATIADCKFHRNTCSGNGGGLYVASSILMMAGSDFYLNRANSAYGGGAYIDCESQPGTALTFIDTEFEENYADRGGGMYMHHARPLLEECMFQYNIADDRGGGMYNHASAPMVKHSIFDENESGEDSGGGVYNTAASGTPRFENCLFDGNAANTANNLGPNGGALYNDAVSPVISNCTFSSNSVLSGYGGAVYSVNASTQIINSILWGNTGAGGFPEIGDGAGSTTTVTYSDVGQAGFDGPTNVNADPGFAAGPYGAYYLSHMSAGQGVTSPCVDSGSDTSANLDLHERTTRTDRIADSGQVDLGYHYPAMK